MLVDYELAKGLSEIGFHCKGFWIYMNGERTHTGHDGFDEGEFDFIKDNYLDPVIAEDYEKLLINKQLVDEAYPQKKPEIICAPEVDDVICWMENFGLFISYTQRAKDSVQVMVSGQNYSSSKTYNSRINALRGAIAEGIERLKRQLNK